MARLSERLISLGYYGEEKKPRVSYKENLIRIFHKKRRSHQFSRPTSDNDTPGDEANGWQTPPSFNTSSASIKDIEWPTFSDISDTSVGDRWETPTSFELSNTSIVDETGDQPTISPDIKAPLIDFDSDEQTFQKFLLRSIAVCLLFILLYFSASLNRANSFYQMHTFNTENFGLGYSELESLKIVQIKLKQVQEELVHLRSRMLPKTLSIPNYALESQGARIIRAHPSKSYRSSCQPPLVMFLGIPVWYPLNSPRTVIQGHTGSLIPGRCWSFAGQQGYLLISLSQPVNVSHVTLGHISREIAPSGFMHSSPQHFTVSGFLSENGEGIHLGTFEYDAEGESLQTFELPGPTQTVRYVMLEVMSNWGHPEYTCVYSFKVHGQT